MHSRCATVLLPLLLVACQRAAAPPSPPPRLVHEAYVWQRQWTPIAANAVTQGGDTFTGYRVLAAESADDGAVSPVTPDLAVLERTQQPVTAVIRIDGNVPPPDASALAGRIGAIANDWRAAGVRLTGFELDHACAATRLADYARLLAAVRSHVPAGLKLSIAESPEWVGAPELPALLANVDDSVLQAQAAGAQQAPRFDPAVMRRWIDARAGRSAKPFRVAIPAYGVDAGNLADGKAGNEKAGNAAGDAGTHEQSTVPQQVEDLLAGLQHARPAQVAGIVWFRLPTDEDRRAWSLATMRAVIGGEPLRPVVRVSFDPEANGARDLVLANVGAIDAPVPAVLVVAALGCDAGDAQDGFRLERMGDDWRFVATGEALIRAGRERRVGWLRCSDVLGMKVDDH